MNPDPWSPYGKSVTLGHRFTSSDRRNRFESSPDTEGERVYRDGTQNTAIWLTWKLKSSRQALPSLFLIAISGGVAWELEVRLDDGLGRAAESRWGVSETAHHSYLSSLSRGSVTRAGRDNTSCFIPSDCLGCLWGERYVCFPEEAAVQTK